MSGEKKKDRKQCKKKQRGQSRRKKKDRGRLKWVTAKGGGEAMGTRMEGMGRKIPVIDKGEGGVP